jgi:hypothetical protein
MLAWAHRLRPCCLAALLVLASGCGVNEYEKKMLESQVRLQRWEEEARVLGSPIGVPYRKSGDTELPIANIFLRLPKNIYNQAEDKPRENSLYMYSEAAPGVVARVELAAGDEKDFVSNVMRYFRGSGKPKTYTTSVRAPGRETPTTFETTELEDDKYIFFINIHTGSTRVAIIYWVNKSERAKAKKLIDTSLQTFAADNEARKQGELYQRRSPLDKVPDRVK